MKILFALNHPAHYHLFKNVYNRLQSMGHSVLYAIKDKDILEKLMIADNQSYHKLFSRTKKRKNTKWSVLASLPRELIKQDYYLYKYIKKERPDLLIGTDIAIAHIGKLTGKPSFVFNDDDYRINKMFCISAYPFASHIVSPDICDVGSYSKKKIGYPGYQKLAYLHPSIFTPDPKIIDDFNPDHSKFFLIRMVSFTASHDVEMNHGGLTTELLRNIIKLLEPHGKVFITSESEILPEFSSYKLPVMPKDIHHVLAGAGLFISDSQSMTVEAAVLGTPSIRFNSFAGKIAVLEELEHAYGLTSGINNNYPQLLYDKISELLHITNIKEEYLIKRNRMLKEKIDLTSFLVWMIDTYPESIATIKTNVKYQLKFIR